MSRDVELAKLCAECEPIRTDEKGSWTLRLCALHFETQVKAQMMRKALQTCINHLEACERDEIAHPFKSASLPLARAALAAAKESR